MMAYKATVAELRDHDWRRPKVAGAVARRRPGRLPLLMILAIGVFFLATIRQGHEWGDDFSMYIQHAKNISQGLSYRHGGYLYCPPYVGPDAYPPVFPLLLVPVYWLFGLNLTAMKVELILAFLGAMVLFTMLIKDRLATGWQAALLALIGFNPYFWDLKDWVISEVPFLVMAYLSLYLVHSAYQSQADDRKKLLFALATGVTFYLAYGTRTIGIVLLPSLFLFDLLRNRRPTRFAIGAAALMIALMVLQSVLLRGDRGYYDQVQANSQGFFYNWMKFILMNAVSYTKSLTELWDNGYAKLPRVALTGVISGLAVIGYLSQILKKVAFVEVFVALYVLTVVVVPLDGGVRYLIPVVPFYMFYALQGIKALPLGGAARKGLLGVLLAAVLLSYAANYSRQNFKQFTNGVTKAEAVEFFDYVKTRTSENDVFIFTKPRALALFTGRKSSFYPEMLDDKGIWNYFERIHATHIVTGPKGVDEFDQAFLAAFIARYAGNLQPEYANADFKVYRITGIPEIGGPKAGGQQASRQPESVVN